MTEQISLTHYHKTLKLRVLHRELGETGVRKHVQRTHCSLSAPLDNSAATAVDLDF